MNTPSRELIAKIIFQLLVFFRQQPRRSARDSNSPPSPPPDQPPGQPPSSNSSYPDPDPLALARVTWVGTRLVKSQLVPPQILVHIPNKYLTHLQKNDFWGPQMFKTVFFGKKCFCLINLFQRSRSGNINLVLIYSLDKQDHLRMNEAPVFKHLS